MIYRTGTGRTGISGLKYVIRVPCTRLNALDGTDIVSMDFSLMVCSLLAKNWVRTPGYRTPIELKSTEIDVDE